jgi:signal peptidase I
VSHPDTAMTDETPPAAAPDALEKTGPEKKGTDWWSEFKAIFWLVLAVLGIHSFIAKPFYIPSESMMPVLLEGDRLVVSKYPYGWSWVSLSFHIFPRTEGRLLGRLPERGDIVILTPRDRNIDYIKRVVALPGDTVELVAGQLYLNGQAVKRERIAPARIPIDANAPCDKGLAPRQVRGDDGVLYCELPVFRETLPGGRTYDTIDLGYTPVDDFAKITVPAGEVFLMGDNRDQSADSRVSSAEQGLGGPVPWENIGGRAEFITFSLDGTSRFFNPVSWFTALRDGRAGDSLRPAQVPAQGAAK